MEEAEQQQQQTEVEEKAKAQEEGHEEKDAENVKGEVRAEVAKEES